MLNKYAVEQKETRSFLKVIGASKFELEHGFHEGTPGSLECYHLPQGFAFPPPKKTSNGLLAYYLMDAASILPVVTLGVDPSSTVLDMCAAPGGKSVLIAQLLSGSGVLVSNEPVYTRRGKLFRVRFVQSVLNLLHINHGVTLLNSSICLVVYCLTVLAVTVIIVWLVNQRAASSSYWSTCIQTSKHNWISLIG